MKRLLSCSLAWLFLLGLVHAQLPDTVLIDFGNTPSPAPWNQVSDPVAGSVADLLLSDGTNSGISLLIDDAFNNINLNGTTTPKPQVGLPGSATGDSFFGNVGSFGGQTQPTARLVLGGLSATTAYDFLIFASRMGVGDNREAQYVLQGAANDTVYLDAANNDSLVALANGIFPAADGTIRLLVSPGPNNTNGTGFYYLGAVRLSYLLTSVDTVQVDFGNTPSLGGWNNVSDPVAGTVANMITSQGLNSGIALEIDDAFNNINTNGTTTPDSALHLPGTATGDSFFGNVGSFGGQTQPTAGLRLSGLDKARTYSFSLFASRMGVGDNRETRYVLTGADSDTLLLDASNNDSLAVSVAGVKPNGAGEIRIDMGPGPNNTNGTGFYYLGALRMTYLVPQEAEPQPEELTLLAPTGGERWESGKSVQIRWKSTNVLSLAIEFSDDLGQTWAVLDTVPGFGGAFAWTVPGDTSGECLVRLTASQLSVTSDSAFSIVQDNGRDCHIVVLGSSTAAGTGSSTADSAWVNRYRNELYRRDTDFRVTNLAQGGFTTYNILPTGTTIPTGVNQTINALRNITYALTLDPDGIIINMPSNDAANGYPVAAQLTNYEVILAATGDSVPVWICTPQPRDFGADLVKEQIQLDLRDSTFARFDTFAIDFWTGLANSDNEPEPAYDSGDGIHLNDAGHLILFQRVMGAGIPAVLQAEKTGTTSLFETTEWLTGLVVVPNPLEGRGSLQFSAKRGGVVSVHLLDLSGRQIDTVWAGQVAAGQTELPLELPALASGWYLLELRSGFGEAPGQRFVKLLVR